MLSVDDIFRPVTSLILFINAFSFREILPPLISMKELRSLMEIRFPVNADNVLLILFVILLRKLVNASAAETAVPLTALRSVSRPVEKSLVMVLILDVSILGSLS